MNELRAVLIDWAEMDLPQDWVTDALSQQGIELAVARSITQEALIENASQVQAIVVAGHRHLMTAENMDVLPGLVAIVKLGSGVDIIDVEAATQRGIVVANTPKAVTDAVSDHAIALLLAAARRIPQQNRLVREGVWSIAQAKPGRSLRGSTLGVIGYGRIGKAVAEKLTSFEIQVLVYDPAIEDDVIRDTGAEPVSLDRLLSDSHFISVHCPLTETTRHLIGERALQMMRSDAILINTARGSVVDETALVRALREGWIAGAGLDVFEQEPIDPHNPLLALSNVIVTPHIAPVSDLFPGEIWKEVCQTLIDLAQHRWPASVVNHDVKPKPSWSLQ